jgi:hypothetical protein
MGKITNALGSMSDTQRQAYYKKLQSEGRLEDFENELKKESAVDTVKDTGGKIVKGAVEGSGLAGSARLLTGQSGKGLTGAEKASAIGYDVFDLASMPLQGVMGTVMGGLVGAGLNVTEANKTLGAISQAIQSGGDFRKYLPESLKGSVLANFIAQIPGGVWATAFEAGPAMLGFKPAKGVKPSLFREKVDVAQSRLAEMAQKKGIPFSESAEAMVNPNYAKAKPMTQGQEVNAKIANPEKYRDFKTRQKNALWKEASNATKGVEGIENSVIGQNIKTLIERFKPEEGKIFMESISPLLEGKIKGDVAKTGLANLARVITDLELEKGAKRGWTEKDLTLINNISKELSTNKSLKDLWGVRKAYDTIIDEAYKDIPNQGSFLKGKIREAISQSIEDLLPNNKSKILWKEANLRYSQVFDALDEVKKFIKRSPEKITDIAIKDMDTVQGLIESIGKEQTQLTAMKSLMNKALKNGEIDIDAMKKELMKNKEAYMLALGDSYKEIKSVIDLGEFVENPQIFDNINKKGGAQTASKILNLILYPVAQFKGKLRGAGGIPAFLVDLIGESKVKEYTKPAQRTTYEGLKEGSFRTGVPYGAGKAFIPKGEENGEK